MMENRKEYYAILQMVGPMVSTCTLVEKPEKMDGIWISSHSADGNLHILADDECMEQLSIDTIVHTVWLVVLDHRSNLN